MKIKACLIILFILNPFILWGADEYEKRYVTVVPGKQYKAGWLHRLFLGKHWRALWTIPLKVEVLDLGRFAGGLTPVKRGGGKQTKSLRFKGQDGAQWKFRSLNKDPKNLLPKEFQDSLVESVLQDQISSANPMAPLIVVPILNAVGILQAKPKLVWLPDDKGLGEYQKEFGGMLGTIELHPTAGKKDTFRFEGAKDVINTFNLYEHLSKNRDEKVDSREYLKARLVDMFIGDWDRHSDQWRWAKYKEDGKKLWKPIPRDRDNAFVKLDGIVPRIASYLVMDMVHFSKKFPLVKKLTWSGRYLDRRYLTELDKSTWDSVVEYVKSKLTDGVIEEAVNQLPPECYKKVSMEMIGKLKSRRDKLTKVSKKYYRAINKVVDIFGSSLDDYAEINRIDDKATEVSLFKHKKKKGIKKGKPFYYKIFDNRLTSEIRLYLGRGDDFARIVGIVNKSPLIRVIGGKGKDELVDDSKVKGYFLTVLPFKSAESKTIFYDSGKKSIFKKGPGTKVNRKKVPKHKNLLEKYESRQKNRGHELYGFPIFSFNNEDGMVIGAGAFINKYDFRVKPYDYKLAISGSYATKTKSSDLRFQGIFNSIIKGTSIHLDLIKTQLLFNNYYGFGNKTTFDKELEKNKYYGTKEEFVYIRPSLHLNFWKKTRVIVGLGYSASNINLNNESLLVGFPLEKYGLGSFKFMEINSGFQIDTRDNFSNPYKGFFFSMACTYYPKLIDNQYSFFKSEFESRFYFSVKTFTDTTFALRLGGAKIWGDYPFFSAVFLGGSKNLRGYNLKRFSGDAALYGQMEIRTFLGNIRLILPGRLGFHIFSDVGRVYKEGETSDKWHPVYGGGVWISFANRMVTTCLSFAKSPEKLSIYITLQLMY